MRAFVALATSTIFTLLAAVSGSAVAQDRPAAEAEGQIVPPGAMTFVAGTAARIICVFNAHCSAPATDTSADIALPAGVTGTAQLQTRTFVGAIGRPAEGKTAYLYRVDMSRTVSDQDVPCVTDLTVDFGPAPAIAYDGSGKRYEAFVLNDAGSGTVGLYQIVRSGNAVTFTFSQPICAGATPGTGMASFFFGLASDAPPKSTAATVGWPGLEGIPVKARAPGP
jgi:hypothetical protein